MTKDYNSFDSSCYLITGNTIKTKTYTYTPRFNSGGNYCGHYPHAPDLDLLSPAKTGKGGLPPVLTYLIDRLKDYYATPTLIPSLNLANGSTRQQRSCRREACVRILSVLLKHTDLSSLRVGLPTAEGFMNMTMSYLIKDTGLTLRRAERAIHDLKAAQLITITQARELKENGDYKGLAAVRCVSRDLFGIFGLSTMLKSEQKKAVSRLKKKVEQWSKKGKKITLTQVSRFRLVSKAALSKTKKGIPLALFKQQPSPSPFPFDERERHKLQMAAFALKVEHPDWDSEKCFEEAGK